MSKAQQRPEPQTEQETEYIESTEHGLVSTAKYRREKARKPDTSDSPTKPRPVKRYKNHVEYTDKDNE